MHNEAATKERIVRWLRNCGKAKVTVQDVQLGLAFWGHAGARIVRDILHELLRNGQLALHEEPDTFIIKSLAL